MLQTGLTVLHVTDEQRERAEQVMKEAAERIARKMVEDAERNKGR